MTPLQLNWLTTTKSWDSLLLIKFDNWYLLEGFWPKLYCTLYKAQLFVNIFIILCEIL